MHNDNMNEIRLYRKNQLGIGTWRIWVDGPSLRYAHAVVEGGAEIQHSETIVLNQSGRTFDQQAKLEMDSRISRQLDKGYKHTREEALAGSTNQLGFTNPMLAHPIERVKNAESLVKIHKAYVQRKYDGHRCLITKRAGEIYAYTRKGKIIDTIPHILKDMMRWLPEGMTTDGELYIHGQSLQSLSSLIKRDQPGSKQLCYLMYDIVDDRPYAVRHALMSGLFEECQQVQIQMAPTYPVTSLDEAYDHFRQFRKEGYEGAMLRLSIQGYQDAVRANQLLKLKEWQDEEVTVLSVRPSKDGWAVLTCKRDSGETFDTSAPGTIEEKKEVLENFDAKYKGRRLTVEYANATADGKLFHCAALRWHEEV